MGARLGSLLVSLLAVPVAWASEPQPSVHLLDAGAAPREVRVLHPQEGLTQRLRFSSTARAVTEVSLLPDPAPTATEHRWELELQVRTVDAHGIAYDWRLLSDELTITPAPEPPPLDLSGLTGSVQLSPSGLVLRSEVHGERPSRESDAKRAARMASTASHLGVVLPAEPIGEGARWEVRDRHDLHLLDLDLVTTWELLAIDGDSLVLGAALSGRPADPELRLGEGLTGQVESMLVEGTGRFVQPLGGVAPAERRGEGHYAVDVRARKGILPIRLQLDIRDSVRGVSVVEPSAEPHEDSR